MSRVGAAPITFTGSSGALSASLTFDTSGTNLIVTLTNTSTADVLAPNDVLTAVFFDIAGNLTLAKGSAVLNAGSTVLFGVSGPGGNVGGEWAYHAGLVGAPGSATQGISSVGFDLFGPGDLFPGFNITGPTSPDGLQFGITSAGDNPNSGNAPVTGNYALIKNSVVFTLGGLPSGFDPSLSIRNVTFQYGTDLAEGPAIPSVPTPATLLLLGAGLIGCAALKRD